MSVTLNFTGVEDMVSRLAHGVSLEAAQSELHVFGEVILKDAQENFVPVAPAGEEHSGALRDSGRVEDEAGWGEQVAVRISFGDETSRAYAIAVHEYPSDHSPTSWKKGNVQFHTGGPKYLERPVMEHMQELEGVAAAVMIHTFEGI